MLTKTNIIKIAYNHISIVKKYNLNNHQRYKQADKFITAHKFEKIKNYKDFCTKPQQVKNVQLTLSEEQENYIHTVYNYERRDVAWTKKMGLTHYRLDDNQLQYSIEGKTLLSFIKQGIKQRKPHQMLLFNGILCTVVSSFLYFNWWYGSQNEDYIANQVLSPQYTETYTMIQLEPHIREYKRKMGVQLQQLNQNNQLK